MTRNEARDIADAGFAHIAGDAELVGALLAQSGSDVAGLRAMAARPEFSVFVLDFLLEHDQRVLDFAQAAQIAPQRVLLARAVLGGGDPW
ncbi:MULTISPECIES: DUF3572 domain-containing protein [Paracoccus]|uniref:Uncharacterized protein DUF3572 n=1 Tax=Paracoccus versutus TaxID=34007 RepID=A0A369TXL0_PARVE|nr:MULTISPECIES: DUF3572 domain-containing protein [Paracoccus]WGR63466.1 DUF3572 family protein [Paracoccus ferrooxidans]MCJ1902551.1 DUF3572 domain-containing protein [Paracoccus versutus]MDF3905848.1 DUF3572 domain-containing protein [Paracoccus sp. AS002]RDD70021.1 DUF3572 family protein [Paracoccus versutus]REF72131.1 uncharacterized protein DUF3572 [Paracoccus versutus]